jgi:hypothetical protein
MVLFVILKKYVNTVSIKYVRTHITEIGYDGKMMLEYNIIDGT